MVPLQLGILFRNLIYVVWGYRYQRLPGYNPIRPDICSNRHHHRNQYVPNTITIIITSTTSTTMINTTTNSNNNNSIKQQQIRESGLMSTNSRNKTSSFKSSSFPLVSESCFSIKNELIHILYLKKNGKAEAREKTNLNFILY